MGQMMLEKVGVHLTPETVFPRSKGHTQCNIFKLENVATQKVKIYLHAKFIADLSQFTAELLLLPVSENKRLPYCNSTSVCNLNVYVTLACCPS